MIGTSIVQEKKYIYMLVIGMISILLSVILMKLPNKRTDYGNEMLGKIKGFKHFLETAEKHQLETLVNDDPEYFYDILPYTYALGISNKWIKQFEKIALKEPEWYECNNFDMNELNDFMNNTLATTQRAMTSTPSNSGGGSSTSSSSSGGGSSGGGSGGGGGGSW